MISGRTKVAASALAATGLIAALLLAGRGGRPPPPERPPSVGEAVIKPPIAGLIDRNEPPPADYLHALSGFVVRVGWSELQKTRDGPITPDNPIDRALKQVRILNGRHDVHLALKIRLMAGIYAPEWAKGLGGAPFRMADETSAGSAGGGTVGRFWRPDFGSAWAQLQTALAAQYDGVPEIRDVTIARCMTVYAEPLIRQLTVDANVAGMLAAGFTWQADQDCQRQSIDAASVWRHTPLSFAFNPYRRVESVQHRPLDMAFTLSLMGYCRRVLGARCVLENNSLKGTAPASPSSQDPYQVMYVAMQGLGGAICYQTQPLTVLQGNLPGTLAVALAQHATAVELPVGYQRWSAATLAPVNAELAARSG